MMDTKDVRNQQSGSPSQSGQGNPSNATKQPGQQTQQAPKKDVQGGAKKEEPQKTGTGKH
jgi:hypothetical protein